jgi:hypothetical protein
VKHLKTIFAVALAVTAAMALYVSSASAATSVLCKSKEPTCNSSNILPAGSYLAAAVNTEFDPATNVSLQMSAGPKITCLYGALGAKSTAQSGSSGLPVITEKKNPSGCSSSSYTVEYVEFNAPPGTLFAQENNGGILELGTVSNPFRVIFAIHVGGTTATCTYGASWQIFSYYYSEGEGRLKQSGLSPALHLEAGNLESCGGKNATLSINEDSLGAGGYPALS